MVVTGDIGIVTRLGTAVVTFLSDRPAGRRPQRSRRRPLRRRRAGRDGRRVGRAGADATADLDRRAGAGAWSSPPLLAAPVGRPVVGAGAVRRRRRRAARDRLPRALHGHGTARRHVDGDPPAAALVATGGHRGARRARRPGRVGDPAAGRRSTSAPSSTRTSCVVDDENPLATAARLRRDPPPAAEGVDVAVDVVGASPGRLRLAVLDATSPRAGASRPSSRVTGEVESTRRVFDADRTAPTPSLVTVAQGPAMTRAAGDADGRQPGRRRRSRRRPLRLLGRRSSWRPTRRRASVTAAVPRAEVAPPGAGQRRPSACPASCTAAPTRRSSTTSPACWPGGHHRAARAARRASSRGSS